MAKHEALSDPDEIRDWANAREGRPAIDRERDDAGLCILFADETAGGTVELIDWETFFEVLHADDLELIVQDRQALGARSRFYTLAKREE